MPVKFSGAAYRFGHSLVRRSYRANLAGDAGSPFFALIFDSRVVVPDGQNPLTDPGDLRDGFRAPRRFLGWQTFFDSGGAHSGRRQVDGDEAAGARRPQEPAAWTGRRRSGSTCCARPSWSAPGRGLLLADRTSYLRRKPHWEPSLGPGGRDYDFASFFRFAGVDPDSRGQ